MIAIEVDPELLLNDLAELARIGVQPGGGITRLAYTSTDVEARVWFMEKAHKAGLNVSIDPVGNILALEPGSRAEPPVLSGSHLDSVPDGGRFDGALGVAVALEAVRSIRERDDFHRRRRLGVLVLAAEESSRFGVGCLGSRTIVEDLRENDLETLLDSEDRTFPEVLKQAGLDSDRVGEARRSPGWFHEFVELHIDQGSELFQVDVPLGIITDIAAPTRLRLRVHGQQAHSGATRMHERRDALAGAAEVVLAVEATARAHVYEGIVGTVGVLKFHPQSMNMVPSLVELGLDIRGINSANVDRVIGRLTKTAQRIAENRGLTLDVSVLQRGRPVQVRENRVAGLENACKEVGAKYIRMVSMSAHDAMYLSLHGPINMLFVRNLSGISHNRAENASDEDVIMGASVLATYLVSAAKE